MNDIQSHAQAYSTLTHNDAICSVSALLLVLICSKCSFSVDSFQFDIRADSRVHSLQASIATVFYNVVLIS